MSEREKFEAWVRSEDPTAPLHRRDMEGSERFGEYCAHWIDEQWTAWQASRRAALEEMDKALRDEIAWRKSNGEYEFEKGLWAAIEELEAIRQLAEGGKHE